MKKQQNFIITVIFIILILGLIYYLYTNNLELQKMINQQEQKKEAFYNQFSYPPYTVSHIPESPSQRDQMYLQSKVPQSGYTNLYLPAQAIGCGGRRGACMGGSQVPIPNTVPPVDISEQNIAPVNIAVRGYDDGLQQVGTVQRVFGNDNAVYPLFGRRIYRYDNKWEYWTRFGPYGVILPLIPLRNNEELNINDKVYIQGQKDEYRVTIYDGYIPQYFPIN